MSYLRPSEPLELGFGGLSEEPIQTSVGQILPPEPVSQTKLQIKENKKLTPILQPEKPSQKTEIGKEINKMITEIKLTQKPKSILSAQEPPPSILQVQEVTPSILQATALPSITETLVKGEESLGTPIGEASVIIPAPLQQITKKWDELKAQGLIQGTRFRPNRSPIDGPTLKKQIKAVEPSWEPIPTGRVGGNKKKE